MEKLNLVEASAALERNCVCALTQHNFLTFSRCFFFAQAKKKGETERSKQKPIGIGRLNLLLTMGLIKLCI